MSPRRVVSIATLVATASVLAGCASEGPRPTEEITRARTLVNQAEQANAQRYAPAEMQAARAKMESAEDAADEGQNTTARRLASEAALDAQLATARASSSEAQRAAKELAEGTEQLRREAERGAGQPR